MSELGDLLELLHGARSRVTTVRATVRKWQHVERCSAALKERSGRGVVALESTSEEPQPEAVESVVRIWLAPPDRAREERSGPSFEWFGVRRGDLWWQYDSYNGALSNVDNPEVGNSLGEELGWLLDPASVIGLLDFEIVGPGRCAGRTTVRVSASPRPLGDGYDWPLARLGVMGADEFLLDVDAGRGALLRIESRLDGQAIAISEVVDVAFDEAFAEETFVFLPPPGEEVRSTADSFSVEHDLTIEQLVALAPFAVFIPAQVPAGWEAEIAFSAEQQRPVTAPHAYLQYQAADATHGFAVAESPAGHPGEHSDYEQARHNPWREIERDGRLLQLREPAESWQSAQVRLELEGTRILIYSSDLAADWLADLAAGLRRAPSEPPPPPR